MELGRWGRDISGTD